MSNEKRACLVYVPATANESDAMRTHLEEGGYSVCEVESEIGDAVGAQLGQAPISPDLQACIDGADICIFLIPDDENSLGILGGGIGASNAAGKRAVAVLCGEANALPQDIDDLADAVVRNGSDDLICAISGEDVWESPDRRPNEERKTKRVKCQ